MEIHSVVSKANSKGIYSIDVKSFYSSNVKPPLEEKTTDYEHL